KSAVISTTGGSINDDADSSEDIIATTVSLTGTTGIGNINGDIDLKVTTVALAQTNTGGIALNNLLTSTTTFASVKALDTLSSGDISLTSAGAATLTSISNVTGGVSVSAAGNISVGTITASSGAVSLITSSGSINEVVVDGAVKITAASISLASTTGIGDTSQLDVNAPTITSATTVTNGISLKDTATAVIATSINTTGTGANSNVVLAVSGSATLTNITTAEGTIEVDAEGNVVIGSVTAGGGNSVDIQTTSGTINDDTNDALADVTGTSITLVAIEGIGTSSGDLDLNSTTTALTITLAKTGSGGINLNSMASGTTTVTEITTTTSGSIGLVTAGASILADINSASGAVTATAAGNITIGNITDTAGTNTVSLTTSSGSIRETVNDSATKIAAGSVVLSATTGVGDNTRLDVDASTVSASTATNGITLNLLDSVSTTITSATVSSSGNVDVTATKNILVGSIVTTGGNVSLVTSGGKIDDLSADSTTDIQSTTLTLDANLGIGTGGTLDLDVTTLTSAKTVTGGVALNILDPSNGGVLVSEVKATTSGDITLIGTLGSGARTYTLVDTVSGNINISAQAGNIVAGTWTSDSGGSGSNDVTVTATTGSITIDTSINSRDAVTLTAGGSINDNATDDVADVVATSISITAQSGIGASSNTLDMDVTTLTLASTVTGGIYINMLDSDNSGFTVTQAQVTSLGDIKFTATSGTGSKTFSNIDNNNGNIEVASTFAGAINLGLVAADSGTVTVTAQEDITISTSITSSGLTSLTSNTGTIKDDASDNAADIIAGSLIISSNKAIGTGTPGSLDLDVGAIKSITATTGAIDINLLDPNASGVLVGAITASGTGDISVASTNAGSGGGTFTFSSVTAADGDISLIADTGNITTENIDASATSGKTITIEVRQGDHQFTHRKNAGSGIGNMKTTDGTITIKSDHMSLTSGAITSGNADVRLEVIDGSQDIQVGEFASDTNAALGLTNNELNIITTGSNNTIVIGSTAMVGRIDQYGSLNMTSGGSSNVSLVTGSLGASAINKINSNGNPITATNLSLSAGGGIDLNISADKLAAKSTTGGNIVITEVNALIVDTLGSISGISTASGNITLTVPGNLTITGPIVGGGAGTVSITSSGGQINDGNATNDTADITTTGSLTLSAIFGIGVTNGTVDIDVTTLTA
ncbi:MAG: hypothetical protein JKY23_04595, partial [Nitrospinaceae bacterium]|nr:hypothetical protein [Nitrospinaceae bacterium]